MPTNPNKNTEIPLLFDTITSYANISIIRNSKYAGGYEIAFQPKGSYSIDYFLSNLSHIRKNKPLLDYLYKHYPEVFI